MMVRISPEELAELEARLRERCVNEGHDLRISRITITDAGPTDPPGGIVCARCGSQWRLMHEDWGSPWGVR